MTEVLLINPYSENAYGINESTIEPPLGLGYLAAIAEKNNIPCKIIDANMLRMKISYIISEIKKDIPKITGISTNLFSYKTTLRLTDTIKKEFPDIIIILGGPTPTNSPKKILESCNADAVIIGEAEEIFNEVLKNYKNKRSLFKDVNGIIYRNKEKIVKNKPGGFIKDIDSIPFPAYHLFPNLKFYKSRSRKKPVAPLLTSRGCPYKCIFCSKDVFKNACRVRSPENVIKEIDLLVKKYGIKQIDILDDNFTINKKRTEKILDLLIERNYELCINLQSGVRIENIDRDIINKMKKAGIWKMPIGVESGDPLILGKIKKHLDLKRVLEITKMAKKVGIKVYGLFMMGLPGDTAKSMQKTIDFAIKMDPNIANFCITIPFPGTELYDMIKKKGKFLVNIENGINAGFYANQVFYEVDDMDKEVVLKYYKKAIKSFYFRSSKIFELFLGIRSLTEFQWLFNTSFSMVTKLWK